MSEPGAARRDADSGNRPTSGQLKEWGLPKTAHLFALFEFKDAGFPCPPLSEHPWTDALDELVRNFCSLGTKLAEAEAENKRLREEQGVHIEYVAVDEHGEELVLALQRAQQAQADLAAMTKERDEAKADLAAAFNAQTFLAEVLNLHIERLAAAREEARKWEWVARRGLNMIQPGSPTYLRNDSHVDTLLARYQPAEEASP